MNRLLLSIVTVWAFPDSGAAQSMEWIDGGEGQELAATYFAADAPQGLAVLMPGCSATREVYDELGIALRKAGVAAISVDLYGRGESRTPRVELTSREGHDLVLGRTSPDLDRVYAWMRERVGDDVPALVGLGGCTVGWSTPFLTQHPELRGLVSLSGPLDEAGRAILASREGLAILGITAADRTPRSKLEEAVTVDSSAPNSRLLSVPGESYGPQVLLEQEGGKTIARVVEWSLGVIIGGR